MNLIFAQCESHSIYMSGMVVFSFFCCWIAWKDAINYMIWVCWSACEKKTQSDNSSICMWNDRHTMIILNLSIIFCICLHSFFCHYIQLNSPSIHRILNVHCTLYVFKTHQNCRKIFLLSLAIGITQLWIVSRSIY